MTASHSLAGDGIGGKGINSLKVPLNILNFRDFWMIFVSSSVKDFSHSQAG